MAFTDAFWRNCVDALHVCAGLLRSADRVRPHQTCRRKLSFRQQSRRHDTRSRHVSSRTRCQLSPTTGAMPLEILQCSRSTRELEWKESKSSKGRVEMRRESEARE